MTELPGVEKSDIAIEYDGHALTLRVDPEKRRNYKRLDLPVEVDLDTFRPNYKNGVLELGLARKVRRARPKQIPSTRRLSGWERIPPFFLLSSRVI